MIAYLVSVALAGGVYINGQQVDPLKLPKTRLPQAEVLFDAAGNVYIMAPGYQVPPNALGAPPAPVTPVAPVPVTPSVPVAPMPVTPAPSTLPAPRAQMVTPSGVPRARYWLATEDNASGGQVIEVLVNGAVVATVRSGEPTRILDLAPHLKLGSNDVLVRSTSTNASGGVLYVYLGTGADQNGTVVMDAPDIQFGVGKSRSGSYERRYTLDVRL